MVKMNILLDKPKARKSLFYLIIFTAGFSFSITGSVLPDIAAIFGLTKTQVSTLPLLHFSGSFCGLLLLGYFLTRPRLLIYISVVGMATATLSISFMNSLSSGFLTAFFCFGLFANVLIAIPGMIVTRSQNGSTAGKMNIMYSFFSAGVMISPIVTGVLFARGFHYPAPFLILTGLIVLCGITALATKLPAFELGERVSFKSIGNAFSSHAGLLIIVIVMNLCYVGAESVPHTWIPKYFYDTFPGYSEFRLRLILSLFWASITAGRQICAYFLHQGTKPQTMLTVNSVAAALLVAVAPVLRKGVSAEMLFIGSGLFFSGMFPIIISFVEHFSEKASSTAFILVMASGLAGASVLSRSVGFIADRFGFTFGIMIGALPLIAILILVFIINRVLTES
jgi:fucose permease